MWSVVGHLAPSGLLAFLLVYVFLYFQHKKESKGAGFARVGAIQEINEKLDAIKTEASACNSRLMERVVRIETCLTGMDTSGRGSMLWAIESLREWREECERRGYTPRSTDRGGN